MENNALSPKPKRIQNIMMENRKRVQISGVEKVGTFTDQTVNLVTAEGGMIISGKELKIVKFSVDEGVLSLEGQIDCLKYVEAAQKKNFLARLFK